MNEKGMCKEHGEFNLAEGCPQCLAEKFGAEEKVTLAIKVTAPEGAPEGEEQKVADEIVKLTETIAEIQGNPKPETATSTPEISTAEPVPTAIVRVKPEQDIEVQSFYDQALKLAEYAEARDIAIIEDLKPATDDLSIIARVKKALEAKRKEFIQPLQDHIKEINDAFKRLMEPIEIADKTTRSKILAFQQEQERIRREQEEVNRLRMEAAQKEMELKGELSELVSLVEVSPEAPKRVSTDMGTAGQRDNWKWEVVDFALVPDGYKMINSGVLTPVVKASKGKITIPGIRIYNEPIIAVNAR